MPRRMIYAVDVDVPAAQMYADFTAIDYWQDLVEHYRENAIRTEIAHFHTDEDGTDISFAHLLSGEDLPAIARPVISGTFVVTRVQHFDPFCVSSNTAAGRYRAEIKAPIDVAGSYLLADTDGGSQMRMETECRARVPLIGGQMEQMLLAGLKTLFAREGEFTADWLAAHH